MLCQARLEEFMEEVGATGGWSASVIPDATGSKLPVAPIITRLTEHYCIVTAKNAGWVRVAWAN